MPHPFVLAAGVVIVIGASCLIYNELNRKSDEEEAYHAYCATIRAEKEERRRRLSLQASNFDSDDSKRTEKSKLNNLDRNNSSSTEHDLHQTSRKREQSQPAICLQSSSNLKPFGSTGLTQLRHRSGVDQALLSDQNQNLDLPLIDLRQQFYPPLSNYSTRSSGSSSSSSSFRHSDPFLDPPSALAPVILLAPDQAQHDFESASISEKNTIEMVSESQTSSQDRYPSLDRPSSSPSFDTCDSEHNHQPLIDLEAEDGQASPIQWQCKSSNENEISAERTESFQPLEASQVLQQTARSLKDDQGDTEGWLEGDLSAPDSSSNQCGSSASRILQTDGFESASHHPSSDGEIITGREAHSDDDQSDGFHHLSPRTNSSAKGLEEDWSDLGSDAIESW